MDTKTFRIFQAQELDLVDWLKFQDVVRWSLDRSQFILEYQTFNAEGLTQDEAWEIMCGEEWTYIHPDLNE